MKQPLFGESFSGNRHYYTPIAPHNTHLLVSSLVWTLFFLLGVGRSRTEWLGVEKCCLHNVTAIAILTNYNYLLEISTVTNQLIVH